jgi:hypothetical protein
MKQSRGTSFLKSIVSTGVGFGVAMIANALVLPLFGFTPSLKENLLITCIYTVISVARGYLLERAFEAMGWRTRMSAFAMAVLAERQRQKDAEGWSESHDDEHATGVLCSAGASYAISANAWANGVTSPNPPACWPWDKDWWKPTTIRRDLTKSAALILAEGERFDRRRQRRVLPETPCSVPMPAVFPTAGPRPFPVTDSSVAQRGSASHENQNREATRA